MSKQDLNKRLVTAFGGGIAVAGATIQTPPPATTPPAPEKATPKHDFAIDIEQWCESAKCSFLGQSESDPSYVMFEDNEGKKFRLPQDMFRSFRPSNDAEKGN